MRTVAVGTLLLTLAAAGPALASNTPEVIAELSVEGTPRSMSCDFAGNIYVAHRYGALRLRYNLGTATEWPFSAYCFGVFTAGTGNGHVFITPNAGGGRCGMEQLFKFRDDGNLEWNLCTASYDPAVHCSALGLAFDRDSRVLYAIGKVTRKYSEDGDLLEVWDQPSDNGEAWLAPCVGRDGVLYVADPRNRRIQRYAPDGTYLGAWNGDGTPGRLDKPVGIAAGPENRIYVGDGTWVKIFDADGGFIDRWQYSRLLGRAVAVDEDGHVYAGTENSVLKFDNVPGPPPVDPAPPHPAAVLLHVSDEMGQGHPCKVAPRSLSEVVTSASVPPDGGTYYVYVLGTPNTLSSPDAGLTGFQLGIQVDTGDATGVQVWGWTSCGMYQFPMRTWPQPGTGNTITWAVDPLYCQRREIVTAGYFYISAYSPSVASVTGYPTTGLVKVADCRGAEILPDIVIPADRVGWVSLGGAARGASAAGCNPGLAPCDTGTPTRATTWGRLKSRH